MNKTILGYVFGFLSTFFWALNSVIPKIVNDTVSPFLLNTLRWGLAFLLLLPFSLKFFKKENLLVLKKYFVFFSIIGFTGITSVNSLFYIAGETSQAINLSLIAITSSIFTVLIAVLFLKRKIYLKEFIGIILAIVGVVYLISNGSIKNILDLDFNKGDILALIGALFFAIYSVYIKKIPKNISNHLFLFYAILMGLVYLIPCVIYEYFSDTWVFKPNQKDIISIIYSAVFSSVIGYYLWNRAVIYIGIVKTSSIYYLTPVIGILTAVILVNETLHFYDIISMLLIVFGVYLTSIQKEET